MCGFTCPTPVYCPTSAPFKCFDNQCKRSLEDCPKPPNCGVGVNAENPFFCAGTGVCVKHISDCNRNDQVVCQNPDFPIKCPGNLEKGFSAAELSKDYKSVCFSTCFVYLNLLTYVSSLLGCRCVSSTDVLEVSPTAIPTMVSSLQMVVPSTSVTLRPSK